MEDKFSIDPSITAMAIKLIQPGMLSDVVEGVRRLVPESYDVDKDTVSRAIARLIDEKIVTIYAGRRYVLTEIGEDLVRVAEIRYQLDIRRMFLLLETRRSNVKKRSGTRDRSLKQ